MADTAYSFTFLKDETYSKNILHKMTAKHPSTHSTGWA